MTLRIVPGGGGFDASEWKGLLRTTKDKSVIKSHENVRVLLMHHPEWHGKIRYDAFAERVMVTDCPWGHTSLRPWTETDDLNLVMWIDRQVWKDFGKNMTAAGVEVAARESTYHPVLDYLNTLVWDGEPRADLTFVACFGAEDTEYNRGVARRWLISAVARVLDPGCKADCIPVLEGVQGIRKSSGLRALCGAKWFNDSEIRIGHNDAYASLHGKWIHEIAELSSFSRSELGQVKAFAASQSDHYRGAYERRAADHPRQCVFAATTNESEWQRDETGGRRWWPVACSTVNVSLIEEARDQVWAEAVALYRSGASWWADTLEFNTLAKEQQKARQAVDPWQATIELYVMRAPEAGYTTQDILTGSLGFEVGKIQRGDSMRVGVILRSIGYTRVVDTTRAGAKVRLYYPT